MGAALGLIQGSGNTSSSVFASFSAVDPLVPALFFGIVGLIGPFLKPPKERRALCAFAVSALIFSAATYIVLSLPLDIKSITAIMSLSALGLGSGIFVRLFIEDVIRGGTQVQ